MRFIDSLGDGVISCARCDEDIRLERGLRDKLFGDLSFEELTIAVASYNATGGMRRYSAANPRVRVIKLEDTSLSGWMTPEMQESVSRWFDEH